MAITRIYVRFNCPVNEVCMACKTTITEKWYVRDLTTRIIYHNDWCLGAHVGNSEKAIEHATMEKPKKDLHR